MGKTGLVAESGIGPRQERLALRPGLSLPHRARMRRPLAWGQAKSVLSHQEGGTYAGPNLPWLGLQGARNRQ